MILERENLDNPMQEDLDKRNRDRDAIELAVEELSDGLDIRYTKTETDGLLEAKVDKSKVPSEKGLQTVVDKNQFYPIAQDITGRIIGTKQESVWDGSGWSPTNGVGIGHNVMYNNTGAGSNAIGHQAMQNNIGSTSNGIGHQALFGNTGQASNGIGYQALFGNTGPYSNGVGQSALYNNTGERSNGVGYQVLQNNTGSSNSAFGHSANNTADTTIKALSNTTCLGAYTLPNKSNQVVLGNGSVDTVKMGGTARTPVSSTATGVKGETCWDTDYFYICVATNIWKRIKMEVW